MPVVPNQTERDLPRPGEVTLHTQKRYGFSRLGGIVLVSSGLESPHGFAGQTGSERWRHQLTTQLVVPAKAEIQLLPKLADEERGAAL
jgi:hypothetical protein